MKKLRSIVIPFALCIAICGCQKSHSAIAVQGLEVGSGVTVRLSGKPVKLSARAVPENATESYAVVWQSADPSVARVAADGTVTPVKKGSVVVFCYLADRSSVHSQCALNVVSNGAVFEDERFAQAMPTRYDKDGDGEISPGEAETVKRINVRDLHIRCLKGIEFFENLGELDCSMNNFTAGEGVDLGGAGTGKASRFLKFNIG